MPERNTKLPHRWDVSLWDSRHDFSALLQDDAYAMGGKREQLAQTQPSLDGHSINSRNSVHSVSKRIRVWQAMPSAHGHNLACRIFLEMLRIEQLRLFESQPAADIGKPS